LAGVEDFELEVEVLPAAAGVAAAAGAAAAPVLAAGAAAVPPVPAALFTPPCPLQAPRPLCVAVVPSLHTGLVAVLSVLPPLLCASDAGGAPSSAAANTVAHIKPLNFASFIDRSPLTHAVFLVRAEYRNPHEHGISVGVR
jgi:hypothetical protein